MPIDDYCQPGFSKSLHFDLIFLVKFLVYSLCGMHLHMYDFIDLLLQKMYKKKEKIIFCGFPGRITPR